MLFSTLLLSVALIAGGGCGSKQQPEARQPEPHVQPASEEAAPKTPKAPETPETSMSRKTSKTPETSKTPGVVKGFGISPEGFPQDYSRLPAFFKEVGGLPGGGVMFNGAWMDNPATGEKAGRIPEAAALIMESARSYGFTPVAVFGWRSSSRQLHLGVPNNPANNWTNTEARRLFKEMLAEFAGKYQPPFMFLGNENSFYFEENPDDYANWIAFYNDAYTAVKAKSPSTRVGPVFNFEHLSGSGRLAGYNRPHWEALAAHDPEKMNVVGLTVYPWLQYKEPNMVPDNYLDPILERVQDLPIAITETGWPADKIAGLQAPWEISETAQVDFVTRLSVIVRGKNTLMVNWLYLHPIQSTGADASMEHKIFGGVSLYDPSGNKRPVYDAWLRFEP